MRPVIRVAANPAYPPAVMNITLVATRNTLAAANPTILPLRGVQIYSTPQVTAWMTLQCGVNGAWRDDTKAGIVAAVNNLKHIFESSVSDYGTARLSLINNFGQYCAYCGVPVYDSSLAVEHMLPKSEFPDIMMCYTNFLLTCPNCNSKKLDNPSYAVSTQWAEDYGPPNPIADPNYEQIKIGGYDKYVWPVGFAINNYNNASAGADAAFVIELKRADNNEVIFVDIFDDWISNDNNSVTASVDNEVLTVYTDYIGITYPEDSVIQNEITGATNMINMVKLNYRKPDNPRGTDRRNVNRTIILFETAQAIQRYQLIASMDPAPSQEILDTIMEQINTTARYAGFYEVWISVTINLVTRFNVFYTAFKNNTLNDNLPYAYFPGTDGTRLP